MHNMLLSFIFFFFFITCWLSKFLQFVQFIKGIYSQKVPKRYFNNSGDGHRKGLIYKVRNTFYNMGKRDTFLMYKR